MTKTNYHKDRPIEESKEPFYWQPEAYSQSSPSRTDNPLTRCANVLRPLEKALKSQSSRTLESPLSEKPRFDQAGYYR